MGSHFLLVFFVRYYLTCKIQKLPYILGVKRNYCLIILQLATEWARSDYFTICKNYFQGLYWLRRICSCSSCWCCSLFAWLCHPRSKVSRSSPQTTHHKISDSQKQHTLITYSPYNHYRLFIKLCHWLSKVPFFLKMAIFVNLEVPFFIWNKKNQCAARGSFCQEYHPPTPPPSTQWRN